MGTSDNGDLKERAIETGRIHSSIIDAIGNTPIVALHSITQGIRTPVAAKIESTNPGGSVKDRIGIRMVEEAERKGWLRPGGTIVEPTSGNTGVGLAMAAAVRGYHCIFVMPDKVAAEKVALLRAYGAEVVTTPTAVERDSPESYYSVADRLTREVPGAFQPNQYFNPMNPRTHYETTGPEIWKQTDGRLTHFVAGVGTGGTISGIARYLKEQNHRITIIGADPEGSIFTSDQLHTYKVEGVGEDFWPGTFDRASVDRWVRVSDRDAFLTARALTRQEGILAGGSGGLAAWAALQIAKDIDDPNALVIVLLPDSGRGYLSKLYNDDWMRENGFLSRFRGPTRLGQLIPEFSPDMPDVIAVACDDSVEHAIEVLRFHEISQVPVVRSRQSDGVDIHAIAGSLQERTLLDHLYRNPEVVNAPVSSIMDAPFDLVDANDEIERVFPLFGGGAPAVLVQREGKLVGVVTRADLLEFAARHSKRNV